MTREELEKATGQELIEQRDYCGVDGYYGDYLDNVNAEMLKRFNRLADLENKIADIKANCDLAIEGRDIKIKELEQEIVNLNSTLDLRKMQLDDSAEIIKEMQSNVDTLQKKNAELELELTVEKDQHQEEINLHLHAEDYIKELEKENAELKAVERMALYSKLSDQLTKAKELLERLVTVCKIVPLGTNYDVVKKAEQFLKEIEK